MFSSAVLGGIALFQVGILKHLPDPPLSHFHADAVHSSPQAYAIFGIPDGLLGMGSYAATAWLAAAGPKDLWKRPRWLPVAMGCKTVLDAAVAGKLTVDEAVKFRKFSAWSLIVAAATIAALALAIPEAVKALRDVRACSN